MVQLTLSTNNEIERLALTVARSQVALWKAKDDEDHTALLDLTRQFGQALQALDVAARALNPQFFLDPGPRPLVMRKGVLTMTKRWEKAHSLPLQFDALLNDFIASTAEKNGITLDPRQPCCDAEATARGTP